MESSRRKRLKFNTVSSLLLQITTIICGLILPRLIMENFGTEVNGLLNSIMQFLQVITFLDLGVGAVVQSSLYGPLAHRDTEETSKIIRSAGKFFKRIALILLAYMLILAAVYPFILNQDFDSLYTAALILIIGISSFAQYYFGMVDGLLLQADQRGYVQYTAQIATLILNTGACVLLIKLGMSIHLVKLATSVIYLFRPCFLRFYVNRHYKLDRRISYTGEPIRQKWNGIAQHVASTVLEQTDVIVLTAFSTLANVSIYSVYHMVIYGVKNLFISMTNGFRSLMGEMLAKEETEELNRFFRWMEWLLHTGTVFIFGCISVLIVPFVAVYTKNVTDADYTVPAFALLITLAHAGHCLRLPYNSLILAAGHYKQTQRNYIVAALINIVISVLSVRTWGLIGVAIGTLCAMFYQTVWMAIYDAKNIIPRSMIEFIKHMAVDTVSFFLAFLITFHLPLGEVSYLSWIKLSILVVLIWFVVIAAVNYIAYREYEVRAARYIANLLRAKRS